MSTGPSLYRRHRPRTFADVVGQEQVVRTLSNAVSREQVHHAYLFVGSRGTGKTSMAKILAACLNCVNGPTVSPCGVCESCVAIQHATSLDVIEMDAASNNSVDDIRDLRESVAYAPVSGRHKVYILDEAHMLSPQAWNAFLKTLEEPPPRTIFVLATTEAQKVLPTVVDRCHRFDFGRPTVGQLTEVVSRVAATERIDIDPAAVALIARHATGSFRDALGTLEQLLTYAGEERIVPGDVLSVLGVADAEQLFEALDSVVAGDGAAALRAAARLTASGRDPGQILRDLELHGRELLAVQMLGEVPEEIRVTPERDERLLAQARALAATDAVRLLDLVSVALEATANGAQARIQLELVLVKAAAPEVDPSAAALLARIERLEGAIAGTRTLRSAPSADPAPSRSDNGQHTTAPGENAANAAAAPAYGPRAVENPPAAAAEPSVREAPAAPEQPSVREAPAAGAEQPSVREAPAAGAEQPSVREAPPAPSESPSVREAPPTPADQPPAEPPRPAVPDGPPELATVAACWPAVIDIVRQGNQLLGALLVDARPVSLEGSDVTLAFPKSKAFAQRKAQQDDYRRATTDALRSVTGASLNLRYELRDVAAPEGAPDAEPAADAGLSQEELVRRLVEEFDAKEVLDDPDQET
jgi:DNA polymerase-3 subunit gamma/tau